MIPLIASEKYFRAALQPYLRKNIGSPAEFQPYFLLIAIIRLSQISAEFCFQPPIIFKKIRLGGLPELLRDNTHTYQFNGHFQPDMGLG